VPEVSHIQYCLDDVTTNLRTWFGASSGIAVRTIDGVCPLFPEEEACLHRAVTRRRQEFSTGRWCARKALVDLGMPPTPILVGRWRNPLWPSGIVGSISHTMNICAAVVAHRVSWKAIGIDLLDREAADSLLPDAARLIVSKQEESGTQAVVPPFMSPLALLFSAKESVIKALSPQLQRFIDFREIHVRFENHTFKASLRADDLSLAGWWEVAGKLVLTGAVSFNFERREPVART
jgi:4'-phosphopantetheinyl transferase EntD